MIREQIVLLKNNIRSGRMLTAVLAVPAVMIADELSDVLKTVSDGSYTGYWLAVVLRGLEDQGMLLVFPILCALPGSAAYIEQRRCGIYRQILSRMGRMSYIWSSCVACSLAGGLVLAAGIVLTGVLSMAMLGSIEPPMRTDELFYYLNNLSILAGMYFLSGCFWSLFGMFMSIVTNSRFTAYLSPFAGYYLLVLLQQRYFKGFNLLNPGSWILPEKYGLRGNTASVAGIVTGLAVIMLCTTCCATKRNLKDA